jgi:hypothetical protein
MLHLLREEVYHEERRVSDGGYCPQDRKETSGEKGGLMYTCQLCNKVVAPNTPQKRLVEKEWRTIANSDREELQICRERPVCEECFAKHPPVTVFPRKGKLVIPMFVASDTAIE